MEKERIPVKLDLQFFAEEEKTAVEEGKPQEEEKDGAEATGKDSGQDAPENQTDKEGASADVKSRKEDIAALVAEEIKKASMTPEEKEKYEASEREKRLEDREKAIAQRELQADAKEILAENGLPAGFRDMVLGKDKKETVQNVKALKEQFDAAVQAQVELRLRGRTPHMGSGISGNSQRDSLLAEVESYL